MGTFYCEAINAAGQTIKDHMEAQDKDDAITKLRARGLYPTKVAEKAERKKAAESPINNKNTGLRSIAFGRVSQRALGEFTSQLSILQDAGLPIVRSLRILWQQERAGVLKNILAQVADGVESGATLSEAMSQHPKAFDRLYVNMIQAGETGGVLDVILQRLAEFMDKAQRLRRRIIGAMIYPSVVILFSVLILTGIMMFVVPRFGAIFKDFGTKLPAMTEGLISVADFIAHDYGWAMVLGAPVAAWLTLKMIGRSSGGRLLLDIVKLKIPIVGRIVRKTAVSRFSRTLGTLLAAGVPILEALGIARDTVGNAVFARALQKVQDGVREGETLVAPLRAAGVCDPIVTNMIDVGEETGDLDKMLLKIAETYDDQVDVLIGSMMSLLEPVMVVALGGTVGTIVIALFLPLVAIMSSFTNGG